MKIYNKQTLQFVGQTQHNTAVAWEIENNVIPNFGGIESDYSTIETDLTRFHLETINGEVVVVADPISTEEKKDVLRSERDRLLDEADIKYCNAEKWELMSDETKALWRTWKQNMKDWVDIDLDNGVFPNIP